MTKTTKKVSFILPIKYKKPTLLEEIDPELLSNLLNNIHDLLLSVAEWKNMTADDLKLSLTHQFEQELIAERKKLTDTFDRSRRQLTTDFQLKQTAWENRLKQSQEEINTLSAIIDNNRSSIKKELATAYQEQLDRDIKLHKQELSQRDSVICDLRQQLNRLITKLNTDADKRLTTMLKQQEQSVNSSWERRLAECKKAEEVRYTEMKALLSQQLQDTRLNLKQEYDEQNMRLADELEQAQQDISDLKQQLQDANTSYHEQLTDMLNQQEKTLAPLSKLYGGSGTSQEKGQIGEEMIYQELKNNPVYSNGTVIKTAGQTAMGDLRFLWKRLKCLIEIKNKQRITQDDVNKFHRDLRSEHASQRINCAVFVSLHTKDIPNMNSQPLKFDIVNNIPVIYIWLQNISHLYLALISLSVILRKDNTDNNQLQKLANYYLAYHSKSKKMCAYFNNLISKKRAELHNLQKELADWTAISTELYNQSADFVNLFHLDDHGEWESNIPDDTEEGKLSALSRVKLSFDDLDKSRKVLLRFHNLYNKLNCKSKLTLNVICDTFSITREQFKLLFSSIIVYQTQAKELFLSETITEDIIMKLKSYKAKHGEYPNSTLLKKSFIKRNTLEVIRNVIRVRFVQKFIYDWIDS